MTNNGNNKVASQLVHHSSSRHCESCLVVIPFLPVNCILKKLGEHESMVMFFQCVCVRVCVCALVCFLFLHEKVIARITMSEESKPGI
jgi:hypothetical protein